MVGSKGKGRISASKAKSKTLAIVPAEPEPLQSTLRESSEMSLDKENENDEIPKDDQIINRDDNSVDENELYETICGPLVGNKDEEEDQSSHECNDDENGAHAGNIHEEKDQSQDECNDKENDALNEIKGNKADEVPLSRDNGTKTDGEDPEQGSHGSGAVNSGDTKEKEVRSDNEDQEEVSVGGASSNAIDVEDFKEHTNEVVMEAEKEPGNQGHDSRDMDAVVDRKCREVATQCTMITCDSLAATEHHDNMTDDLQNEKEDCKLNAEEPMGTLAENGKMECTREDTNVANTVKEAPANVNRPKSKRQRKKVDKKKMVLPHDVVSVDEGKVQSSSGNDASGEANGIDANKHVINEEKAEVKQPVMVNKKRKRLQKKKVPKGHAGTAAASDEQKSQPLNNKPRNVENKETKDPAMKSEEPAKSGDMMSRSKNKGKKKAAKNETSKAVNGNINKGSERIDSMGMIFMCSSETKRDCYRYKVLGLPATKKDIVMKIYKGMRLFLFDIDLRMMYGIYKASDPGGYNIEPRAFKSQFPSQVRFTVIEECVPLAEERFKRVIKDNYYTKNKFHCQLNSEQVKSLCKLFHETSKKAESKLVRAQIPAAVSSVRQDRKRKRAEDSQTVRPISSSKRQQSQRRAEVEISRGPFADDRYYQRPVVYERETYLPSATATVYQPLPPPSPPCRTSYSYAYERAPRADIYRWDSTLDRRELGHSSLRELHRPVERDHHDPFVSYREPLAHHEPAYASGLRRDTYDALVRSEDYEYSPDYRRVEYYRPAEYRAALPPYRRY